MRENKKEKSYRVFEVGGMNSEWESEIGVVEGLKSVVELLMKKIGSDKMDGEDWVESINKESDWEDWDERGKLWGNECFEVIELG